jgi:hypothetical protein
MTETNLNMNIDQLLDGTLDDLADVPEYKDIPAGVHRCNINFELKQVGDKKFSAVQVTLTAIETVELPAGATEGAEKGLKSNVLLFLQHDNPMVAQMGQGKFKEIMKALAASYGDQSPRALMEAAQNSEVLAVTSFRQDKRDKTKQYFQLDGITVM